MKFRRERQLFIILVLLVFIPVCVLTVWSVYKTAVRMTGAQADFYMIKSGHVNDLDEKLAGMPYAKWVLKKMGWAKRTYIPAKYLGEEVVEDLKTAYVVSQVHRGAFTENNEFGAGMDIIFVDREYYERLEKLNRGKCHPMRNSVAGRMDCCLDRCKRIQRAELFTGHNRDHS